MLSISGFGGWTLHWSKEAVYALQVYATHWLCHQSATQVCCSTGVWLVTSLRKVGKLFPEQSTKPPSVYLYTRLHESILEFFFIIPRWNAFLRLRMSFTMLCIVIYPVLFFLSTSARQKFVRRAWEKAQVNEKWSETNWAKKIEARQKVRRTFTSVPY